MTDQKQGGSNDKAKEELLELMKRRADAEKSVEDIEKEIYEYEGKYFTFSERAGVGNIVTGYLSHRNSTNAKKESKSSSKAVYDGNVENRIFSNSSTRSAAARKQPGHPTAQLPKGKQ